MPAFSTCPRCCKPVSIPSNVDAAALVRCPLCDAEYPLREAFPPELIPVLSVARETAPESNGAEADAGNILTIPLETDGDLTVAVKTEEPAEYAIAGETQPEAEEENAAAAVVGRLPVAIPSGRRRPPKPWWQKPIEVVSGGLAGLLVGYYALAAYHGPQFKTVVPPNMQFSLPGIAWLTTPADKSDGDKPDNGADQPAAEKPVAAKPANGKKEPVVSELSKEPSQAAALKPAPKLLRPQPGSAEYVGPRMPPSVTSDQLGEALKAADKVVIDEKVANVPAGDYQAFCRLGEAVTFVNGEAADAQLTGRIKAAEKLLEKVAKQPALSEDLGRKAAERISGNSDQNAGILLAGTVKDVAKDKQGRIHGTVIELAGSSQTVSVLGDREFKAKVGDQVLVLGIVVRDPGASLVGYADNKPAVVWVGASAKRP